MACVPTTSAQTDFAYGFLASKSFLRIKFLNFSTQMNNDNMNPTLFREIVKDDGRVTQRQLLDSFMDRRRSGLKLEEVSDVSIDSCKVPVLINPKQFEAIQLRRRVRSIIEKVRIESGRPKDNRRVDSYKSLGKHLHAMSRVRSRGVFVATVPKSGSLCN